MSQDNDTKQEVDSNTRSHKVTEWTSIGLKTWRNWDFDITHVYRVSKFNMFIQPTRPGLEEKPDPGPGFIFRGLWYLVDEKAERSIERTAWTAYFLAVLVFSLSLYALTVGLSLIGFFLFVMMYIVMETFMPFSLKKTCSGKNTDSIHVAFNSLIKINHFPKSGTIMLGWQQDDNNVGLAFRLKPTVSEALIERIMGNLRDGVDVTVITDAGPAFPPSRKG